MVYIYKDKEEGKVLDELELLANTADYNVIGRMTQHKDRPDKAYYMGSGKLEELRQAVQNEEIDVVIFDNDLSGSQFNNLEKYLSTDVIDRATLILEIFARHATSNEGKLQVELARKKHSLPRVLGQGSDMSRLGGGGGGGRGARRGAGEQQLELDKRTIRAEIKDLETKAQKLTEERKLRRARRDKSKTPLVCIVGYTNAGKSTLLNHLTKADVLTENKLFATLDPVSKKMWLAPGKEFILTDTVGFISRLPHEFIDAFSSTLEETKYADLILHVVDGAGDDVFSQFDTVNEVLRKIGADNIPSLIVINKSDKIAAEHIPFIPSDAECVYISALTGSGIPLLKQKISFALFGENYLWE